MTPRTPHPFWAAVATASDHVILPQRTYRLGIDHEQRFYLTHIEATEPAPVPQLKDPLQIDRIAFKNFRSLKLDELREIYPMTAGMAARFIETYLEQIRVMMQLHVQHRERLHLLRPLADNTRGTQIQRAKTVVSFHVHLDRDGQPIAYPRGGFDTEDLAPGFTLLLKRLGATA